MKVNLPEFKMIVADLVSEAKKKKKDEKKSDSFQYAEAFDFSDALGAYNLYKNQGASNFGPYTGTSSVQNDAVIRSIVKETIAEALSPWRALAESIKDKKPDEGFWEKALKVSDKKKKE
jgi:hypothetical protein